MTPQDQNPISVGDLLMMIGERDVTIRQQAVRIAQLEAQLAETQAPAEDSDP